MSALYLPPYRVQPGDQVVGIEFTVAEVHYAGFIGADAVGQQRWNLISTDGRILPYLDDSKVHVIRKA